MKKKIIAIILGVILIIIVAIFSILYFFTNIFKSNEELFWKYFAQNTDIVDAVYNKQLNNQYEFMKNNSYVSNGNLSIVMEQGKNSSKQLNVSTNSRHDINTGRTYSEAILKNGDIDLFKVSCINSGDIYGVKCDEIFPNYIGIQNSNLNQLVSNFGIADSNNIPSKIDIDAFGNLININQDETEYLKEVYFPIIINKIQKDQYSQKIESIQIGEETINCNVYSLVLTSDDIKSILRDILSNLKLDEQTMTKICNKFELLGMSSDYTEVSNLQIKIDELIKIVENMQINDNIEISVYENNNKVIKTVFTMNEKFIIIYSKNDNSKTISIEIPSIDKLNNIQSNIVNDTNTNEIIDLNKVTEETKQNGNSKIVLTNQELNNTTIQNIQIIPNVNNETQNANITINIQSVQNESFSNSYNLTFNMSEDEHINIITVNYDTNTSKNNQIEEIEELNASNTAIANNYQPDEYKAFLKTWSDLFKERLIEKISILGFY